MSHGTYVPCDIFFMIIFVGLNKEYDLLFLIFGVDMKLFVDRLYRGKRYAIDNF